MSLLPEPAFYLRPLWYLGRQCQHLRDGSIVPAKAESHDDLFWALKGGGPNFGLGARYDVYTTAMPAIWVYASTYPVNQSDTVLNAFYEFLAGVDTADLKASVNLIMRTDHITTVLVYTEPGSQTSAAFAPFDKFCSAQVTVPAINATTATARPNAKLYEYAFGVWRERAQQAYETTGANQSFNLEQVPANMAKHGILKGGKDTLVDWEHAQDDDTMGSVTIDTAAQWDVLANARGLYLPFIYSNHAGRGQDPLVSYGPESLARLWAIARKYGPCGVSQTLQNGGFLHSRSAA
ncbi:hypothetical protein PG997_015111 [Apiospora hydei]|uniref:Berberine/berberine-like domain-containing protein n=1 Tax=Apiospora hydei TaxID=1337664 RepID=A0ABR1UVQ4_9PEZI